MSSPSSIPSPHWILKIFKNEWGRSAAENKCFEETLNRAIKNIWPVVQNYGKHQLSKQEWTKTWAASEPTLVTEIFESVLCSVGKRFQQAEHRVKDPELEAYLMGAFKYCLQETIAQEAGRRRIVELVSWVDDLETVETPQSRSAAELLDNTVLVEEICRHMNEWTESVWLRRKIGLSWKEISSLDGGDHREIKKRFFYELKKIRLILSAH